MPGGQRTLTIKFIGDAKSTERAMKDVVSGLDDTTSAGKRYAAAIDQMTEKAVSGAKQQSAAIEALSNALGSDTVAAIERAGGSVEEWVTKLKRAGLSLEDLQGDVDDVAASIRRAEAANGTFDDLGTRTHTATREVEGLRTESDQTKSVLANMVGNSVQDLGALGGVAGTVGMAIGQIGEYATEGGIGLAGIAKYAGPMAGVAIAGLAISKAVGAIQKKAEDARKETESLGAALDDLAKGDARAAAAKFYETYSKVEDRFKSLGLTATDWLDMMRGQGTLLRDLNRQYEVLADKVYAAQSGVGSLSDADLKQFELLSDLIPQLESQVNHLDNAVTGYDKETEAVQVLTRELQGQQPVNRELINQYGRIIDRTEGVGAAMQETTGEAIDPMQQALDDLGVQYDKLKGKFDDRAAIDRANEALANLMTTAADEKSTWTDLRQASDDYALALADVVMAMDDIPTEVKSMFLADIDAGQLNFVQGQLDALAHVRTAEFQLLITTVASDELKQMEIRFNCDINGNGVIGRAAGGSVSPGMVYAVGDNPDGSWNSTTELFVPNTAGSILSAADSRAALGGGSTTVYLTQVIPPNPDVAAWGRQTVEAILAYQKQAGPVFQTVR